MRVPLPNTTGMRWIWISSTRAGRDALLADAGTTHDAHHLVAGRGLGLLEGAFDAVGDEPVDPSVRARLGRLVGHHEDRPPGRA
jgi:hypothetical protein